MINKKLKNNIKSIQIKKKRFQINRIKIYILFVKYTTNYTIFS